MPTHFLPRFCAYTIAIAALTVGVAFFWSASDDPRLPDFLQAIARVNAWVLVAGCVLTYRHLIRMIGDTCRHFFHTYRSRKLMERLYRDSDELLCRAGLNPVDPKYRYT